MRKLKCLILISILIFSLCSCSEAMGSSAFGASSVNPPESSLQLSSSTDLSDEDALPSPSQTIVVDNKARGEVFRAFLSDNYQKLSEAFFGGISGIGFIDLDMDGSIEMLIFDTGASASMGLQFFDIVDGKVECVSANMDAVGTSFGGKHFSKVIVTANYFEAFHLMEDNTTHEKFFTVSSCNGAADFSYSELIRFGKDNGVLALKSLLYQYQEFDIDSGAVIGESYKVNGKDSGRDQYSTDYEKFFSEMSDTGFKAKGVFLSESKDYENGLDGLLAMADKSLSLFGLRDYS